jgi:hypothetical protein
MDNKSESQEQEYSSHVFIKFSSPNTTEFSQNIQNVNPMQLLMLSQYFEFLGKSQLNQLAMQEQQRVMMEEQRKRIVTPKDGLITPDEARRVWESAG